FDFIDDRLKDISNRLIKKDEEDTIRFFLEDMRKFHDALVPLQQPGRNSWSLTEIMMRPFLQNISINQIENRVKEMSMNDVSLLEEVLRYRYDNREIREKLLPDETSFLTNLKSTVLEQEGIEPSILWAKRILLQRLNNLLN
ncbi:MAG: hypothetical protein J1F12_05470, partial [Muribaculaceae bacterium]|nr:hypothetical protein [Muribaculaceae bacterium]